MLEAVRARARSYFDEAPPAHDWYHVERVEALAETLCDRYPEPVDERVVTLAALLHDIGREREDRSKIDDHAAGSGRGRRNPCGRRGEFGDDRTSPTLHPCPPVLERDRTRNPGGEAALRRGQPRRARRGRSRPRVCPRSAIGSPIHDPAIPSRKTRRLPGARSTITSIGRSSICPNGCTPTSVGTSPTSARRTSASSSNSSMPKWLANDRFGNI